MGRYSIPRPEHKKSLFLASANQELSHLKIETLAPSIMEFHMEGKGREAFDINQQQILCFNFCMFEHMNTRKGEE